MIKFYRKIRQKLLSEGKTGKYLKYAIGEIILVVIGILIALQINNYSEEKKQRKLELDLLGEVRNNLSEDLLKIEANINLQNEILRCQKAYIDWMDGEKNYNDSVSYFSNSLSYYITRSIIKSRFLANQGTYETLKQVGMRIIQNDSLRIQITHLYEVTYPKYYIELEDYKKASNDCIPLFDDHLEELNWFEHLEILDINKLRSDRRIRYNIKTLHNLAKLLPNRHTRNAKRNVEKTLSMLNEVIEE